MLFYERCYSRIRANSLAISEKSAGDWEAPKVSALYLPTWPDNRRNPMNLRDVSLRMACWKPWRQSSLAR